MPQKLVTKVVLETPPGLPKLDLVLAEASVFNLIQFTRSGIHLRDKTFVRIP